MRGARGTTRGFGLLEIMVVMLIGSILVLSINGIYRQAGQLWSRVETPRHLYYTSNNLIEVVWGATVAFPPHVARPEVIARVGEAEIRQEFHDAEWIFTDWREYANLGFLGALNEFNQGRKEEARSTFSATLAMFDGSGLRDKAFSGQYETYKLALALYTGARIGAPVPNAGQLRQALLSMQATNGGFYTHYRTWKDPEGDANTETTALALLALKMVGCSSR